MRALTSAHGKSVSARALTRQPPPRFPKAGAESGKFPTPLFHCARVLTEMDRCCFSSLHHTLARDKTRQNETERDRMRWTGVVSLFRATWRRETERERAGKNETEQDEQVLFHTHARDTTNQDEIEHERQNEEWRTRMRTTEQKTERENKKANEATCSANRNHEIRVFTSRKTESIVTFHARHILPKEEIR